MRYKRENFWAYFRWLPKESFSFEIPHPPPKAPPVIARTAPGSMGKFDREKVCDLFLGKLEPPSYGSPINSPSWPILGRNSGNVDRRFLFESQKVTLRFLQPARGPFHHRTPSKLFQRLVRSMLPRKTTRGTEALNRLKVREGIPVPFALKKRCVCPAALRVIRLAPGRRWCRLGDLCKDIGWKHDQTVQELEAKRKHKSALRWNKKKQLTRLREAAIAVVDKIVPKINFGDSKIKIGTL